MKVRFETFDQAFMSVWNFTFLGSGAKSNTQKRVRQQVKFGEPGRHMLTSQWHREVALNRAKADNDILSRFCDLWSRSAPLIRQSIDRHVGEFVFEPVGDGIHSAKQRAARCSLFRINFELLTVPINVPTLQPIALCQLCALGWDAEGDTLTGLDTGFRCHSG